MSGVSAVERLCEIADAESRRLAFGFNPKAAAHSAWSVELPSVSVSPFFAETKEHAATKALAAYEVVRARESEVPDTGEDQ